MGRYRQRLSRDVNFHPARELAAPGALLRARVKRRSCFPVSPECPPAGHVAGQARGAAIGGVLASLCTGPLTDPLSIPERVNGNTGPAQKSIPRHVPVALIEELS